MKKTSVLLFTLLFINMVFAQDTIKPQIFIEKLVNKKKPAINSVLQFYAGKFSDKISASHYVKITYKVTVMVYSCGDCNSFQTETHTGFIDENMFAKFDSIVNDLKNEAKILTPDKGTRIKYLYPLSETFAIGFIKTPFNSVKWFIVLDQKLIYIHKFELLTSLIKQTMKQAMTL